jgi:hypothetical protein
LALGPPAGRRKWLILAGRWNGTTGASEGGAALKVAASRDLDAGREAAGSPSYTASPYFNKSSAYPTDTYQNAKNFDAGDEG